MTIEDKIREIKKATGWTQQKLADHFQVSQSTVNRWIRGAEPEGHRRDAINIAYAEFVSGDLPSSDDNHIWIAEMRAIFERMKGAPDGQFQQIISYARGIADGYEKMRDTAATPDS